METFKMSSFTNGKSAALVLGGVLALVLLVLMVVQLTAMKDVQKKVDAAAASAAASEAALSAAMDAVETSLAANKPPFYVELTQPFALTGTAYATADFTIPSGWVPVSCVVSAIGPSNFGSVAYITSQGGSTPDIAVSNAPDLWNAYTLSLFPYPPSNIGGSGGTALIDLARSHFTTGISIDNAGKLDQVSVAIKSTQAATSGGSFSVALGVLAPSYYALYN